MRVRKIFKILLIVIPSILLLLSSIWKPFIIVLLLISPILIIGLLDLLQNKHSIRKNFPVIGHGRYLLEKIRPEIMQYFVETNTEGRPFNRIFRSLIYQRAKKVNDTTPFGTQMDVYRAGYEWLNHSIYAKELKDMDCSPRIEVGGKDCKKPYSASVLNISAMSFGSLSKNAVMALNGGAKKGNFAHNTGEGSISPYHLKNGGDLIWQVGTGYFGCRKEDGTFCPEKFKEKALLDNVKMIELKISQGAKPGHGGILPAKKNTPEIANIRGVKPNTDVLSPPAHSSFNSPEGLLKFIQKLRELSDGKPVGFKLCIGKPEEFIDICKAMIKTNIKPDFISVDGGEGGTGAAPVEFSNSLGMPLRDGLSFVYDCLIGFNLKDEIKLIASGKITSGFHMIRAIALGADICYSARGMMMSIGCIQALHCNNNSCPVGIATQDEELMKGLDVEDKKERTYNFHKATVHSVVELLAAAGFSDINELKRKDVNRRVSMTNTITYEEIYPHIEKGSFFEEERIPKKYQDYKSQILNLQKS